MQGGKFQAKFQLARGQVSSMELLKLIFFGRLTRRKKKKKFEFASHLVQLSHTSPFMTSPRLAVPTFIPATLPLTVMLTALSLSRYRKCKLLWLFWTMTRLARTMPSGRCLWATTAPARSCGTGRTCWPTPGGPSRSGTPYSPRRRWMPCWQSRSKLN